MPEPVRRVLRTINADDERVPPNQLRNYENSYAKYGDATQIVCIRMKEENNLAWVVSVLPHKTLHHPIMAQHFTPVYDTVY